MPLFSFKLFFPQFKSFCSQSDKGAEWQLHSVGIISVFVFFRSDFPDILRRTGHVLCALSSSHPSCSLLLINNTVLAILAFPPLPLILPRVGPISPPFWLPGHGSAGWGPPSIVFLWAPLCLLHLNRGLRRRRVRARPRLSCLHFS